MDGCIIELKMHASRGISVNYWACACLRLCVRCHTNDTTAAYCWQIAHAGRKHAELYVIDVALQPILANIPKYMHVDLNIRFLGRPTYMSADSYFTTDSFFLSFFLLFAVWSPSSLNGTQPYPAIMVGSKCNLKTHVQYLGYPLPYKSGAQKLLFGPTSQPNGNFNGLHHRNETRYT